MNMKMLILSVSLTWTVCCHYFWHVIHFMVAPAVGVGQFPRLRGAQMVQNNWSHLSFTNRLLKWDNEARRGHGRGRKEEMTSCIYFQLVALLWASEPELVPGPGSITPLSSWCWDPTPQPCIRYVLIVDGWMNEQTFHLNQAIRLAVAWDNLNIKSKNENFP